MPEQVNMLAKGAPIPQSIGRCADLYAETRAVRLAMEKEVKAVAEREAEIREHIINNLSKSEDTGASGLRYRAQIVNKTVPKIAEGDAGWPKLWAFIAKNNRFDLLQKRLGEKAVEDMWENGEAVPGVDKFNTPTVSITKI
jgi:hypothetical protein